MIKKLWVKFNGMEVACFCEPHLKKCTDDVCKEYVVKFMEIDRSQEQVAVEITDIGKQIRKFETEVNKATRKLKNIKLK